MRIENGQTFIDLSSIDLAEFKLVRDGGLVLVIPKKNKWDWTSEERWLRSVVVDANTGRIVSCSWPKFGNYGEFRDDTEILNRALADGSPVLFTHKEDGSLCIRSVVDGKVVMRTRGTISGGESDDGSETYGEKFRRVAAAKYPRLLDPTWMADDVSLLLEYVAPDNAVVVRYREEDLIFLGGVDHVGPNILPWGIAKIIAAEGKLRLVELKELPSDPLRLLEEVKEWRTEGVVARHMQVLVKVKSAWYLANHRMKFSMKYKTIVEFVDLSGVADEDALVAKLREYDYDFEVVEGGREFYRRYERAKETADYQRAEAHDMFLAAKSLASGLQPDDKVAERKEFARIACAQPPVVKSMMFALYDGRTERVDAMVRKLILTEGGKHK